MPANESRPEPGVEHVILVDESDQPVGTEEKQRAHEAGGKLHRAFSVFVFNSEGEMLLQRRAACKYHFAGKWTNACCSHPRAGQEHLPIADVARLRLGYEFGFETELEKAFTFTYKATDPATGLTEHEFDHVFLGRFDGTPNPNPSEIEGWEWVDPRELQDDVSRNPERYTPWFRIALERALRHRASAAPAAG